MTYNLTFEQKPGHLHAIVTGVNSRENVLGYLEAIRGECIARGCSKLLIEERLEGPRLDMLDVFEIVLDQSRRGVGPLRAIAYVDVNARGTLMQFAETAGINRGIPVAVFPTVAEAEAWLADNKAFRKRTSRPPW